MSCVSSSEENGPRLISGIPNAKSASRAKGSVRRCACRYRRARIGNDGRIISIRRSGGLAVFFSENACSFPRELDATPRPTRSRRTGRKMAGEFKARPIPGIPMLEGTGAGNSTPSLQESRGSELTAVCRQPRWICKVASARSRAYKNKLAARPAQAGPSVSPGIAHLV
ncbi:hypothetical protein LZ32DRAFT_230276 [Colletotrichum eremochloae]|nr:hypothetical protein LZ32DRAFT_230276 [Colletotrichum eremochloae]